jgi:vacuolar protein sorting-associated protein 26
MFSGVFSKPQVEIIFTEVPKRHRHKLTDRNDITQSFPTFHDGEDIKGKIIVNFKSKSFEHKGIKVELLGFIQNLTKLKSSTSNFIELSSELESAGTISEKKIYSFNFPQVNMKYESYKGDYATVKYIIKLTIETKFRTLKYENEFCVINPIEKKILDDKIEPIHVSLGIKNLLQLNIEFRNKNVPYNGCMFGKITFKNVQIELKFMEIQIVRREILLGEKNCEPAYLAKFEIMDGGPIKNEFVPVRMFLKPYDLTPTYENVNSKFYVRYFINLVIADQNDERYFKQKEIVLYRVKKDKECRQKEKKQLFTGEEFVVVDEEDETEIESEENEKNEDEEKNKNNDIK